MIIFLTIIWTLHSVVLSASGYLALTDSSVEMKLAPILVWVLLTALLLHLYGV